MPRIDITNQRFSRLVALKYVERRKAQAMWLCRCDCGTEKEISASNLRSNHTKSCGCLAKELEWRKGKIPHNKDFADDYTEPPVPLHPVIHALRRKRYLLRITQKELSARLGWCDRTVSNAEAGACTQSFLMVNDWANALGYKLTLTPKGNEE
jgi:hypothetical protein